MVIQVYPWTDMPQALENAEKEDCHYSGLFDPIIDSGVAFSCGPREYLASVVRLFGTKCVFPGGFGFTNDDFRYHMIYISSRIQVGCCRLRSRDEDNCLERRFGKPIGSDVRTEIEYVGAKVLILLCNNTDLY